MTITIFGSSAPREGSEEYSLAFECGRALARAGFTICNGGYAGTMEAAAKGAHASGGKTIGVTIAGWNAGANPWITDEIRTAGLVERLTKLVDLGDAYVILQGGTGTLLEFAFVLELINKDFVSRKPIVLLGDTWDGVLEALKNEPVSLRQKDPTTLVQKVKSPAELVRFLQEATPPDPSTTP